jgi:hypothetical protein
MVPAIVTVESPSQLGELEDLDRDLDPIVA